MDSAKAVSTAPVSGKHPRQLYLLFFTEMWERFSFYGMKALLLAYMVTQLKFDEPMSYGILGAYSALVYTTPVLGGYLADHFLGYRRSVIFGGILMSIGHLVLAIPEGWSFYAGMAFIICGNGFFKPNISSLVGTLYDNNDPRKDSAFSFFYMGINIGAAIGGALCGYVGEEINWHYGFGLAGIFMILGTVIFALRQHTLGDRGLPPNPEILKKKIAGFLPVNIAIYAGVVLFVPIIVALFHRYEWMDIIMFSIGTAAFVYLIYILTKLDKDARTKLMAAMVMIIFSALFWAFYEQNAGSLNLFAMRNVDMHVGNTDLPPLSVNNFLPPAWVILLSFLFSLLWPWLNKKGLEPSTPLKFSFSFLFLAGGFAVFYLASLASQTTGLIPLWTFVFGYFLIVCGEMCLSPVGLSMITKLSPVKFASMVMGVWFFATAVGEFLMGKIGALMSVPAEVQNNAVASLPYYSDILKQIAFWCLGCFGLLFIMVPVLRRWMKDVR